MLFLRQYPQTRLCLVDIYLSKDIRVWVCLCVRACVWVGARMRACVWGGAGWDVGSIDIDITPSLLGLLQLLQ